jgi:serine/tyrosine/threonine adenylyltransferase
MDTEDCFNFKNSYASLPNNFYELISPEPLPKARLLKLNEDLALELSLNLDCLRSSNTEKVFSGNFLPKSSKSLAMAYAGHQFGNFVPQLGDGRAVLLGEVIDKNQTLRDIQLKGSGRTRFSRRGDGKAPLSAVLREYLISEALFGLNIPTTRSLAIATSGENVLREGYVKGGVLTRVAESHIRFGTFEYFAYRDEVSSLKILADYTIERHYSYLKTEENRYLSLIEEVIKRQANLIAQWLSVGFVHGVMNTDNSTLSGESIDFGPCAFLDTFNPNAVFSSIDLNGRYAYQNQPTIIKWNCARFAETLLPLLDDLEEKAIALASKKLETFANYFRTAWLKIMTKKLGFSTVLEGDEKLVLNFLNILSENEIDFTLAFRSLSSFIANQSANRFLSLFKKESEELKSWCAAWLKRLGRDNTTASEQIKQIEGVNPLYIPRNHLVEKAIEQVVEQEDFTVFNKLLNGFKDPFTEKPDLEELASPPKFCNPNYQTFCGT